MTFESTELVKLKKLQPEAEPKTKPLLGFPCFTKTKTLSTNEVQNVKTTKKDICF